LACCLTVTALLFITLVQAVGFLFAPIAVVLVLLSMVNQAVQVVIRNLRSIALASRRATGFELSVLLLTTSAESGLAIHHLHLLAVPVLGCVLLEKIPYP